MPTGILGLATSLPSLSVSQDEACAHAKQCCCKNEQQAKLLEHLYQRTSIRSRASVVVTKDDRQTTSEFFPSPSEMETNGPGTANRMRRYDEEASKLAIAASKQALHNADFNAADITHVITVSCTGFSAPGFDLQLVKSLGMSKHIYRTHVGFMGCHGAMNALRVAEGFCASNPNAIVLLCATEICSIHFQYGWTTDNLIANSLFADGAAALIIGNRPSKINYAKSISYVVPDSSDAITWQIGDNGFAMSLSVAVPSLIEAYLPHFLSQWLERSGLALQQIQTWAVHPGGPRILEAVERCLNLSPDALTASRKVLADCGNMSSPTVLFILENLLKTAPISPCLMLGFGPGLTIEAALFLD
jgi:predicted naringenin-chalcone synthase